MEKRTKLGLLILIALAILAFGIWYLLQPVFRFSQLPPTLPNNVTPSNTVPTSTTQQIPTGGGTATVSADIKQLQDLTNMFVTRIGSGSASNGFAGYDDVLINATADERTALQAEQTALRRAHPASGSVYGMTTRVASVKLVSGNSGDAQIVFAAQTQRVEDTGDPTHPSAVTYKEATVTFQRQPDGSYLVSNVVWKDINL